MPRSRSRSADRSQEDRRRKRRTGWDVTEEPASTDPGAAAAIAAAAAASLPTAMGGFTAATPTPSATGTLMQSYQNKAMCRIYVGSLDYYLTEAEIKSVFQAFGTIVAVDMPKEGDRSKGFCFIEYSTPEASQMALSTMQNFVLKGRTIKVGRPTAVGAPVAPAMAIRPAASPGAMSVISSAQAGAAAATAILAGRTTSTPQADLASIANQTALTPQKAGECAAHLQGNNRVYVGNVPFGFSSDDLKKIFVCFGSILNCQLLPSQENPLQHRGYGFIEFASADAAKLAIETMNGFEVVGKQLKVNYATAVRQGVGDMMMPNGMEYVPEEVSNTISYIPSSTSEPIPTPIPIPTPPPAPTSSYDPSATPTSTIPEHPKGTPGSTKVLLLSNMVSPEEVDDDLKDEIAEECSKYGAVETVSVQCNGENVFIYVTFADTAAAAAAAPELHGRWFGGKQINVEYYEQ